ncbi:endonuclease domain-containing 1 protein [Silurus asotus]|uniref:Endonuclease domain-containing 1 protein n=1 Tax=Silurus asotus TaxID=30991 RepID=A0AAD5AV89_SILAS|nr:endonuclease domain-containing 1 protein [Silurus asotus]
MNGITSPTPSLQDTPVFILQHLKCFICLDMLKKPVTTGCGHTFCKSCLDRHLSSNNQNCPLCKHPLSDVKVNIVLNEILKEVFKAQKPSPDEFTGQLGEVPCDICPDTRKYKAVKSCLRCLLSLCKRHLMRHENKMLFREHKLVAPQNELEQWACTVHGRPLELYLVNKEKLICSLCVEEWTNVVSVEEERDKKQTELSSVLSEMKQKIQQRVEKLKELKNSKANCLALIDQETNEIQNVFSAIKKEVQEAEDEALKPLKDRRQQVEQEAKKLESDLQRNITKLSNTISNLETLGHHEDPVFFLQNYPSVKLEDYDWISVPLDTALSFGTIRNLEATMMANIRNVFEKLSRIVNVTLDPDTGHAQLLISDDMRQCPQFFSRGIRPTVLQDSTNTRRYAQICQCLLDQNEKPQYFYATLYDTRNKIPVYSAYEFRRADVDRVDRWYVEPQLDGGNLTCMAPQSNIPSPNRGQRQALNSDYESSGYDKGHLFPVYHTHNKDTMLATSTLTNAAPQDPSFNRGQWKKHEEDMARMVQSCVTAYIVTGVVPGNEAIGNNVRVAQYYWSAYCCFKNNTPLSAGFIGPDNNGQVQQGSVKWLEDQLSKHYSIKVFSIFQDSC